MFTLPCCPSSTSSANHGVAHPQGALKDSFGEAVVVCDMPEPCQFPSHYSCQKRFLWTHKEVDLALHQVIGLVLQVGDTEKFSQALGFEILQWILFSESVSRVHVSQP